MSNWFFTMKDDTKKVIVLSWDWQERKTKAFLSKIDDEKRKKEEYEIEKLNNLEKPQWRWVDPYEISNTWTNFINDVKLEDFEYDLWDKTLVFFDTETTWLEFDADVIEISFIICRWKEWITESWTSLFKTDKKISIWAKMKSWITEDMIENKEYFKDSWHYALLKELSEDENVIFIAHNIEFDKWILESHWIKLDPKRCICTFKLIKLLFPDAESHALVWLKYCYPMILQASRRMNLVQEEHRAWYDTIMLQLTFNFIINYIQNNDKFSTKDFDKILDRMIELTNSLIQMKYIPFWKYKWEDFENIYFEDQKYLERMYIREKEKTKEERPSLDLIYTIEKTFAKFNHNKIQLNSLKK